MGQKRIRLDDKMAARVCENLEIADQLLRKIGDLQLAIHDEESICKATCDEAAARMQKNAAPFQEQIAIHAIALESFAESHKDLFEKAKSIKLQHGEMGWRKRSKTTAGAATIRLIKRFFKDRFLDLVKTEEKVVIKAVAKLSDAEKARIDVLTTVTNEFFAEPAIPVAVDYGMDPDCDMVVKT